MLHLNTELAIKTLSVPSVSGQEHRMRDYIINFAIAHGIEYSVDKTGNLYLTKGHPEMGEFYPCVCAHMDTVQDQQAKWIDDGRLLEIIVEEDDGLHVCFCKDFGLGGDDKAGIAICLSLFVSEPMLKGVFFVMEEAGCYGSENADLSWFRDVGYIIAYDSPKREVSWACGGARLFDRKFYTTFLADLAEDFNINKFCYHPATDIMFLRLNTSLACMNMFAGYYNYHTSSEYCILEDIEDAIKLGKTLIARLRSKEYLIPYSDTPDEDDEYFISLYGQEWET